MPVFFLIVFHDGVRGKQVVEGSAFGDDVKARRDLRRMGLVIPGEDEAH